MLRRIADGGAFRLIPAALDHGTACYKLAPMYVHCAHEFINLLINTHIRIRAQDGSWHVGRHARSMWPRRVAWPRSAQVGVREVGAIPRCACARFILLSSTTKRATTPRAQPPPAPPSPPARRSYSHHAGATNPPGGSSQAPCTSPSGGPRVWSRGASRSP